MCTIYLQICKIHKENMVFVCLFSWIEQSFFGHQGPGAVWLVQQMTPEWFPEDATTKHGSWTSCINDTLNGNIIHKLLDFLPAFIIRR